MPAGSPGRACYDLLPGTSLSPVVWLHEKSLDFPRRTHTHAVTNATSKFSRYYESKVKENIDTVKYYDISFHDSVPIFSSAVRTFLLTCRWFFLFCLCFFSFLLFLVFVCSSSEAAQTIMKSYLASAELGGFYFKNGTRRLSPNGTDWVCVCWVLMRV